MACVLVDDKELENIRKSKYLSSGDEGICYIYKDLIFKIYKYLIYDRKLHFDLEKSDQIAFPEDILVYKDTKEILGYTMKILHGVNIKNGFLESLSISDLKKAYIKLRIEIERFSYIDMENISLTNILFDYDKNHLNLIDTSLWVPSNYASDLNVERLNYSLITAISTTLDWNRYFLNSDKDLFDLYGMYLNHSSHFLEFLCLIEEKVSERKQDKVKTIKDLII